MIEIHDYNWAYSDFNLKELMVSIARMVIAIQQDRDHNQL